MKFCEKHWNMLREAVKERGMEHLGAKSGEDAVEAIAVQLAGGEPQYDPLMDCHWMIVGNALNGGGMYLMGTKPDGSEYCPVCEAMENGGAEEYWINGPADEALKAAREKGLVPAVN